MEKHNLYLEALIERIGEIDENPREIAWIMKDGIWMIEKGTAKMKMPDVIACYYSGHYTLIELKGHLNKREKAIVQLNSGEDFVRKFFNAEHITRKFVVYHKDFYSYEIV